MPLYVLGGGCNTLFPDEGFPGLVLNMREFEKDHFSADGVSVKVSAGMPLHQFAMKLKEAGLGGLEYLAHLPGTVGGALVMNAGFGKTIEGNRREVGDHVREVSLLTSEGNFERLKKEEIAFGYRTSSLGGNILLQVRFELFGKDSQMIQEEMDQNREYRHRVQDWDHPSAGSVFKNPASSQVTVGEMVDQLGLKGTQIGGAKISPIHGNFIVNVGGAASRDVLELIALMRRRISETYQVELETEIQYAGG
jgi:UDP-N-acetylmuramate dehydrogenase